MYACSDSFSVSLDVSVASRYELRDADHCAICRLADDDGALICSHALTSTYKGVNVLHSVLSLPLSPWLF